MKPPNWKTEDYSDAMSLRYDPDAGLTDDERLKLDAALVEYEKANMSGLSPHAERMKAETSMAGAEAGMSQADGAERETPDTFDPEYIPAPPVPEETVRNTFSGNARFNGVPTEYKPEGFDYADEYYEPSLLNFQDEAAKYGLNQDDKGNFIVATVTRDHPNFKLYQDIKWQEALEEARSKGNGIRRMEKADFDAIQTAASMAGSAAFGFLDTATFGVFPEMVALGSSMVGGDATKTRNDLDRISAMNPVSSLVGGLGGALTGGPMKLTKAMVPQTVAGMGRLGRIGQAATVGGTTAYMEGALHDTVRRIGDGIRGDGTQVDLMSSFAGEDAGMRFLLGGGLGAATGVVAEGARGFSDWIRANPDKSATARALRELEDFAKRKVTSMSGKGGIERLDEIEAMGKLDDGLYAEPKVGAANKAAPGTMKAAVAARAKTEAKIASDLDAYAATPEGQAEVNMRPVVNTIVDEIARLEPGGRQLIAANPRFLRESLGRAADVQIALRGEPIPEGSYAVPLARLKGSLGEEAKALVDQASVKSGGFAEGLKDLDEADLSGVGDDIIVILTPRKLKGVREVEDQIQTLRQAMRGADGKRLDDKSMREVQKSIYALRDNFKPNAVAPATLEATVGGQKLTGYSAMRAKHKDLEASHESTFKLLGMNPKAKDASQADRALVAQVADKMVSASGNQAVELDRAMTELFRNDPVRLKMFTAVKAAKLYDDMRKAGRLFYMNATAAGARVGIHAENAASSTSPGGGRLDTLARRLDPLARHVAGRPGEAVPTPVRDAWKETPREVRSVVKSLVRLGLYTGKQAAKDLTSLGGGETAGIVTGSLDEPTQEDIMTLVGLTEMAADIEAERKR